MGPKQYPPCRSEIRHSRNVAFERVEIDYQYGRVEVAARPLSANQMLVQILVGQIWPRQLAVALIAAVTAIPDGMSALVFWQPLDQFVNAEQTVKFDTNRLSRMPFDGTAHMPAIGKGDQYLVIDVKTACGVQFRPTL